MASQEIDDQRLVLSYLGKLGLHFDDDSLSDFDLISQSINALLAEFSASIHLEINTSSLGVRVKQSERLIEALESIGMASTIFAHQISGLDWKALRQVFIALGKRSQQRINEFQASASLAYHDYRAEGVVQGFNTAPIQQIAKENLYEAKGMFTVGNISKVKILEMENRLKEQRDRLSSASEKLIKITSAYREAKQRYDNLIQGDDNQVHTEIQRLIENNERLKQMERDFKKGCRKEIEDFQVKLQLFQDEIDTIEQKRAEINQMKSQAEERLFRHRVLIAGISRQQADESRYDDESPHPKELAQYERRFGELYEQMTLKSDEHRRHLATFNYLVAQVKYVDEHLILLASVSRGFELAQRSQNSAREFVAQFSSILTELRKGVMRSKAKLQEACLKRDEAGSELSTLLSKQRAYYRAIRELQDLFREHEAIIMQKG